MRIPENPFGIGFELLFHENKIQISEKKLKESTPMDKKQSPLSIKDYNKKENY